MKNYLSNRNSFGLMDPFFKDFFDLPEEKEHSVMKTDITDEGDHYLMEIDVPSFKKENIKLSLNEGYLTISANNSSNEDQKDKKGHFIRHERFYENCSRSFYVGDGIKEEDIKAKLDNGTLKLTINKVNPTTKENHYIAIE